jgi:rhamnopyranosyl-N-acetylglucosaminyl-diphospho-decaprenol beta-1,3/1,4-galactofuranosyltransferase
MSAADTGAAAPRIAAVVVTRDRPVLLRQALDALWAQTRAPQHIIVVDNASAAPTVELLRMLLTRQAGRNAAHNAHDAANETAGDAAHQRPRPRRATLEVIRSDVNLGGAGGFALGLDRACAAGFDWVWLLDDDAIARPEALYELERALPRLDADAGAVCGAVVEFGALALQHRRCFGAWSGIERALPAVVYTYGAPPVRIDTASFVGFLVAAEAVSRAGLPRAEFFLAYDDTDYSLALRRAGLSLWLAPASVIDHRRQPQGRLRASVFGPRHYFNVRNRIVVARAHARLPVLPALFASAVGLALLVVSGGWRHADGWRWLGRALRDGYQGRLGAGPAAGGTGRIRAA